VSRTDLPVFTKSFIRIRIPDPYNWITDPDPTPDPAAAVFFRGFKMPTKNMFIFSVGTFTSAFKNKKV
jgi:hypothetical protein